MICNNTYSSTLSYFHIEHEMQVDDLQQHIQFYLSYFHTEHGMQVDDLQQHIQFYLKLLSY